jgi:ribonuclease-3
MNPAGDDMLSESAAPSPEKEPGERERLECLRGFLEGHGIRLHSLDLVSQALTHRSYAYEHNAIPDNERLEFLGDAVLGCAAADFLYERFPHESEGELSKKKSFLVSGKELSRRAGEMGIRSLVRLGRGEESSGGRERASVVGSALEALVGALYFELPFEEVMAFVRASILIPGMVSLEHRVHPDFKSRLQELLQRRGGELPRYQKAREEGPPHSRRFVVEVYVDGQILGTGEGARIKTAENHAARQAYEKLCADCELEGPPGRESL